MAHHLQHIGRYSRHISVALLDKARHQSSSCDSFGEVYECSWNNQCLTVIQGFSSSWLADMRYAGSTFRRQVNRFFAVETDSSQLVSLFVTMWREKLHVCNNYFCFYAGLHLLFMYYWVSPASLTVAQMVWVNLTSLFMISFSRFDFVLDTNGGSPHSLQGHRAQTHVFTA